MKKGYVLIEAIIALALTIIISGIFIPSYLKNISSYNASKEDNKDYFYITEALMFIQSELESSKNTVIKDNIIELEYLQKDENEYKGRKKYISLVKDNSISETYTKNGITLTPAPDRIIANVSEFNVLQRGNNVYVSIKLMSGEALERCLRINTAQ